MRAMILAAGRGSRMQTLTDDVPKPLLRIHDRYLIDYSIAALKKANITEIVINVSYRGEQIKTALGDGDRYGVVIQYSDEPEALETGGGIFKALPLLGKDPFVVLSSDIISDFDLKKLPHILSGLAHLVLVDNPSFHPEGDFGLQNHLVNAHDMKKFTFANIGVYHPDLFSECRSGKFALGPLLKHAATQQQVSGEYYQGLWHNVGSAFDITNAALDNRLVSLA